VGFGNQYTFLLTENLSVAASRFAVHLNDSNVILNLPTPNSATDQIQSFMNSLDSRHSTGVKRSNLA
jgi:hypothetical protein